jgi:hypothetical protein
MIAQPSINARVAFMFRIAAILLAALVLLTGAVLSFRHNGGIVFPDEQEYDTLASNLVQYHRLTWDGVTPTAARPPGFVFWLAIGKSLGLGWSGLVWLNSLLVVAALWTLTKAWFPRECLWPCRTAVFGLLFCYPVTLYVFSTLYPQAFCLALLAFSLALLHEKSGWGHAALAGTLMGWCVLSAPMYLTWVGILALIPLFQLRFAGIPRVLVFGVACALVIGAWGVRNAVVMGKLVPFSTNSGFNLLAGNCENTRPNAGLNIDLSRWTNETASRHMGEVESDAYYSAEAKKWITQHPARAVILYAEKLANYFNFRNELVTASAASPARDALMFATYYGLLALLAARLVSRWPTRPSWADWLVLGGYLACAMFTSLVTTRIRYRVPCDVLLMLVIAPFVAGILQKIVTRVTARLSQN